MNESMIVERLKFLNELRLKFLRIVNPFLLSLTMFKYEDRIHFEQVFYGFSDVIFKPTLAGIATNYTADFDDIDFDNPLISTFNSIEDNVKLFLLLPEAIITKTVEKVFIDRNECIPKELLGAGKYS